MKTFPKQVYRQRRDRLRSLVKQGVILFPGNEESAMNYRSNTYRYRQDSSFLYYFGINAPGFHGVMDLDSGEDIIYGDNLTVDDIIWMGEQPLVEELAKRVDVKTVRPTASLSGDLQSIKSSGRAIHILPPYRGDHYLELSKILGVSCEKVNDFISESLIQAVVGMRSVKDAFEIEEMERAVEIAWMMHTTAMRMGFPGNYERELAGTIEGIALSGGGTVSFPVILSMDGQTLHNHDHGNELVKGRLVVNDSGAETEMGYASDITRTFPVGGRFSTKQKEIYEIVLSANVQSIASYKPGITHRESHLLAARIIATGLKDLGLMKGDMDEAVAAGAHALFFPHGLGHMLGLDVHDMEGLGENYVGYDQQTQRSDQFGLAFLRMGRKLQEGFVLTNEPGCYFIPALIDLWQRDKKFESFINYQKVNEYRQFGGVRIEDNVLITPDGCRILGKPIPKRVDEVEETMNS
ncbi:MAG: aminopeptidase P family protein [Bacteroidales bacterium]|nr:aminopeptidase P family protein [Bacteroidales bacterium]MBN2698004.1 aminopeptidase P family protein [Bacteroidales bacterium]